MKSYKQFISLFNLTQIITDPTRVTNCSSTLIDHICFSDCEKVCQSGIINFGIADHSVIYCTRKIMKGVFNQCWLISIKQ